MVCASSNALEPLARRFVASSMELLEARALTVRQDWKFVVPEQDLVGLLTPLLQTHAVLLAGDQVLARYASQYYDTPELLTYHDHRRERPRRFKVRHRDYLDRQLTMFEVKSRQPRGDTHKFREARPWQQRGLDSTNLAFLSAHTTLPAQDLVPALNNAFRRLTLLGIHANERVTIDIGISFELHGQRAALPGLAIVEVKSAEPRHKTPMLQRLRSSGLRPQGVSKYCVGTTLLNPGGAPAWFARLLRKLSLCCPAAVAPPTFGSGSHSFDPAA